MLTATELEALSELDTILGAMLQQLLLSKKHDNKVTKKNHRWKAVGKKAKETENRDYVLEKKYALCVPAWLY